MQGHTYMQGQLLVEWQAPFAPEAEAWAHKYVMVIDGNTFSSRLMATLTSRSLVFRASLFSEWFDERLVPGVHYIPVRLDYSDLEAKVTAALIYCFENVSTMTFRMLFGVLPKL